MKVLPIALIALCLPAGLVAKSSDADKSPTEITASGTHISDDASDGETVLTLTKEDIEKGGFKSIGDLLESAQLTSPRAELPTRESVRELGAAMGNEKVNESVAEMTVSNVVSNIALKPTDSTFSDGGQSYDAYLSSFRPKALEIAKKHFSAKTMQSMVEDVYRQTFTQAEVDLLIEMTKSEAWKIWRLHQPAVVGGSMTAGVNQAKLLVPALIKASDDALKATSEIEVIDLMAPSN
jgi:hypothetical protein